MVLGRIARKWKVCRCGKVGAFLAGQSWRYFSARKAREPFYDKRLLYESNGILVALSPIVEDVLYELWGGDFKDRVDDLLKAAADTLKTSTPITNDALGRIVE